MSAFESAIRNNPFESLDTIKEKMHDPERAKHKRASSTETIDRVVPTKQYFDEASRDCTRLFKQAQDTLKQTAGARRDPTQVC